MLPDLSFLLGLILGLFALGEPPERPVDVAFSLGGTAAVVLVVAALARMAADRAVRAADETDPAGVLVASRRMVFLPILGWAVALWIFRWGPFVAAIVPSWFLVPYVVLFLPLLLLFASAWAAARHVEARLSEHAPSLFGAVARGLRRNLIVLVPLAILLGVADLGRLLESLGVPGIATLTAWHAAYPDLAAAGMIVMLLFLAWLAPTLFRRTLRATPLPPGDLRRDLEALAKEIGLRCRDFLLWDTRGRVANAMVVGLTARTRYVFLTDGLVSALQRPEIAAVVAHEAGHAKEKHLPLYFVVAIGLLLVSKAIEDVAAPWLAGAGQLLLTLAFLFVFWFVVLGWLSRRFEREADAFGADHGGALEPAAAPVEIAGLPAPIPYGAALMMAVLRRLERLAGPVRHHRHAPPSERIQFLAAYATDPATRTAFRDERRRTRWAVFGLLAAALILTAWRVPTGLDRGHVRLLRIEGERFAAEADAAEKKGDADAASRATRAARDVFAQAGEGGELRPRDPNLALDAAVGAYEAGSLDRRRLGHPTEAKAELEHALKLVDRAPEGPEAAEVRFLAHHELGLLALSAGASPEAVEEAQRHLDAAKAVPEAAYTSALRRARTRLLESALKLRDPDPKKVAQARADLEAQSGVEKGNPDWDDVRDDAAAQAKAVPP